MFHTNLFKMKVSTIVNILIAYVIIMLALQVYTVRGKENSNKTFDIEINSTARSAVIKCKNCLKFHEELLMEVICSSEWCSSNLFQYTYKDPFLTIDQLTPFTTYLLNIKSCKNVKSYKSCMKISEAKQFQTKPSTPRFVEELDAYSKNESSVSLRWKPPYPPTGQLERYEVQYSIVDLINEEILTKEIPIQSCKLWPDYHCCTLLDLESKQNYYISLRAKNKELPKLSQVQTISVTTKKEPSEAPYDLNVQWTKNGHLTLNWKHPNKTNGDIEYFVITLRFYQNQNKMIKKRFLKNISQHTWQYTFTINETEFLNLTQYEIGITAFNDYKGKEFLVNFSAPYCHEENKTHVQSDDHNNKFEQKFLYNNATEIENKNYGGYFDQEQFNNNSSDIFGNFKEKKEEGDGGQNYVSTVNYYEKEQSHTNSSGFSKRENKILKKENFFVTHNLSLIISSVIVITLIILSVLWIKKSSWNNESGCKSMFCRRVSNDVPLPHEEAPLTIRYIENTKSDDILLYTPESIKVQKHEDNKNNPINFESENEEFFSKPIELKKFKEYVDMSAKGSDIENEFKMFVEKTPKTVYETLDHQLFEYIDLMYDDGTVIPKAYVATKVPIADSIENFWKQIFEDNIQLIVLLGEVGSKELQYKYQQYWPEENEKMVYQNISVPQIFSKSYYSYYTIRKFVLIVDETIKQTEQIHCPYSGSNPRKMAPFVTKLVQLQLKNNNSSVLVHSSTEIGGVGTVLLCSLSLRLAHNKKTIDVLKGMHVLRKHKPGFIRNAEQYKLIYQTISHVLFPQEDENSELNDYANF